MIETSNMFTMQLFLLCLMAVGFITAKIGMVDARSRAVLSDLILGVFLPCNILSSFFGTDRSRLPSLGIMLAISMGITALSFALSQFVLYRKAGPEQKKVLVYATIVSNASFLGNPVVESVYGFAGLIYSAVYLIPLRVALWSLGIMVFTGAKGNLKKIFFHPCLIGTYLGLLVMISGFTPPVLVSRLTFSLGNCTTPLSMMVVGNVLGLMDLRKIVSKLSVYFTFIRLLLIPFIAMGVLLVFRQDPMISGIAVILSGMPAGVTTSILADKYGADKELAGKIIFLSTLLSIVTAPLLAWLLQLAL